MDGKSDIAPFEMTLGSLERVHILEERMDVHWGGYMAIEATIALMENALECGPFDRYVLLQGLEYPIKSNREIAEFFESDTKKEYMLAQNLSKVRNPGDIHKFRLYYYLDRPDSFFPRVIHQLNRILCAHGVIPHLKPNFATADDGRKMEIYQGCAQFGLTQNAVAHIVRFHRENPGFNRFFRSMYAADEAYFHTIIYNSPFVVNTQDGEGRARPQLTDFENLTYFEYPNIVRIFTEKEEWPILRDSGMLFFRKATSESKELLDYIDELHNCEV